MALERIIVVLGLALACFAQKSIVYLGLPIEFIEQRINLAPQKQAERLAALRTMFQADGCRPQQIAEQTVPGQHFPNLVCNLPGKEARTIVIGARSGYKDRSSAGIVQWSALAMLSFLVSQESSVAHNVTYVFIAFTGNAEQGSSWYVKQLSEPQRHAIRAMIDLDSIGRTLPACVVSRKDGDLCDLLLVAAQTLQMPYDVRIPGPIGGHRNGTNGVRHPIKVADSASANAIPFTRAQIPAITITSLSHEMLPNLDPLTYQPTTVERTIFDVNVYRDTYRLLCVYLGYLDRQRHEDPVSQPSKP